MNEAILHIHIPSALVCSCRNLSTKGLKQQFMQLRPCFQVLSFCCSCSSCCISCGRGRLVKAVSNATPASPLTFTLHKNAERPRSKHGNGKPKQKRVVTVKTQIDKCGDEEPKQMLMAVNAPRNKHSCTLQMTAKESKRGEWASGRLLREVEIY